jgi:hypothetical protein
MAVVNRFTQVQPSVYNPRSFQELMIAPQYMRKQHDILEEGLAGIEAKVGAVDPLDIHGADAQMEQKRLYDQITEQADILTKEGFSPSSKSGFLRTAKDYQQAISPTGKLGKINAAKQAFLANKKAHIEGAVKGGFSQEEALANWSKHATDYQKEFKATGNITPISQLGAPKYVDYLEEAKDLFSEAGFTEEDLAGGKISEFITTKDGKYVLTQGGGAYEKTNLPALHRAVKWLNTNITNPNSEIYKSIAYQGKSPNNVINEIQGLAGVYADVTEKDDYTATISGWKTNKDLGINAPGSSSYTNSEATNIKRFDESLSGALGKIIGGETVNVAGDGIDVGIANRDIDPFDALATIGMGRAPTQEVAATYTNSLSKAQKKEYDDIVQILMDNDNPTVLIGSKDSPAVAAEVQNYLSNAGNLLKQNAIIQDDFVKMYGTSTGSTSKSRKEIDEFIRNNRADLRFSIEGEELGWDELSDEQRIAFDESSSYQGYMSPKNFEGIHKEGDKELFVSPHVYNIYDPDTKKSQKVYVGRTTGERSSPEFRADRSFNKMYQAKYRPLKTFSIPELKMTYKWDNVGNAYIIKDSRDETKEAMGEEELQNWIYEFYGAK